ncbi:hypothetical protein RVR_959 [Actinacidiphila reveromycinica]|uniref:Uncharacterized protein n=1 Tax=Actinacidiphila reveromycinica TaxID=659352 RepID=A0A7U3VLU7_9ACTN|nr:hypothetical protein RVR_959 [Streptomyces sp. SN-593]
MAAATACGGGGDGTGGGAHGPTGPASTAAVAATGTAPAARMLDQRQLEQAAVAKTDLPGWSTGTQFGHGPDGVTIKVVITDVARLPKVSPAACTALAGIAMGPVSPGHQHHALFEQDVTRDVKDGKDDSVVGDTLLAYQPADAVGVMKDLRASLTACDSFPGGQGERYTRPVPVAAPSVGDDAVEYTITQVVDGDDDGDAPVDVPFRFLVVRVGATVVVLSAMGFPGAHPEIPAEVVTAQIAKVAKLG